MPSYYLCTTGMSRGINDGTSKKTACTWHREYFYFSADGLLASVSEFEDGLYYLSAPARLPVPAGAVTCAAALYEAAHRKAVAYLRREAATKQRATEFTKSLRDGSFFRGDDHQDEPDALPFLSDFTVFDCETTGFSSENDHLLELAAVRYQNWKPVGQLVSFVRCPVPVPGRITQLTGIYTRQVIHAAEPKAVFQRFRALVGDSLLVGHNVGFDLAFVNAARARLGAQAPLANDFLCTLTVAKARAAAPHKLGTLCQRFGISDQGAHRALNDVRMTTQLLQHLHEKEPVTLDFLNRHAASRPRAPSLFAAS